MCSHNGEESDGRIMLKEIYINNFKALMNFRIELDKLTVVAGDNASGKSSIIQAIAFLKASCSQGGIPVYLSERGVNIEDLVSHLSARISRIMTFRCRFMFDDEIVRWEITFLTERTTDSIALRTEHVFLENDQNGEKKDLLVVDSQTARFYNEQRNSWDEMGLGKYAGSRLANLDPKTAAVQYPHLLKIYNFFRHTEPLDLLTPTEMRRSARGSKRTLGRSGEKLPALLNNLTPDEKKDLQNHLKKVLPHLESVDSVISKGGPGWAHLETKEKYSGQAVHVNASGISDGTLRIIALFALKYIDSDEGLTLLDEVEDGINNQNLEMFCKFIEDYVGQSDRQFLITTHSTVLLDYVPSDAIRWVYRNEDGETGCARFSSSEEIRSQLKFLYPGEIILNTDNDSLTAMLKDGD